MKQEIINKIDNLRILHYPLYGFITLSSNLILAAYSLMALMGIREPGPRGERATFFGLFMSDTILSNPQYFEWSRYLFFIFAILWILHIFIPVSSWMTLLCYLLATSWFLENQWQGESHRVHMIGSFLLIHALWYHFYGRELASNFKSRNVLSIQLLPNWVHFLQISYIGIIYLYVGFQKLYYSGLYWANGLSYQLWLHIHGKENMLTQLLLSNRYLAIYAQAATLVFECTAVLGIFSRHFRVISGIGLLLFHLVNEIVFGYKFYSHIVFIALSFLPCYNMANRISEKYMMRK